MKAHPSGPAFPNITPDMPVDGHPGMTLRDYFAAKALQGLIACYANPGTMSMPDPKMAAKEAYQFADAMIAVREKQS